MSGLSAVPPADCAVSVVTVYELFTGVAKCREPERERAKVVRLLSAVSVLSFDELAAKRAGGKCELSWKPPDKSAVPTTY